jgi:hypothetical protein
MSIQNNIHPQVEWPISFNSSLILLTTLATAVAQVLVTYLQTKK